MISLYHYYELYNIRRRYCRLAEFYTQNIFNDIKNSSDCEMVKNDNYPRIDAHLSDKKNKKKNRQQ